VDKADYVHVQDIDATPRKYKRIGEVEKYTD
jgi:hypothetical protein